MLKPYVAPKVVTYKTQDDAPSRLKSIATALREEAALPFPSQVATRAIAGSSASSSMTARPSRILQKSRMLT